jgi:hypothetical protein
MLLANEEGPLCFLTRIMVDGLVPLLQCTVLAYNTELGRCWTLSERQAALASASYCRPVIPRSRTASDDNEVQVGGRGAVGALSVRPQW